MSASSRWNREHGFWGGSSAARKSNGGKISYRSWWVARFKAWRLNHKFGDSLHVYSCYWGQQYLDGETAEKHYHLGHETQNDMWGY